MLPIEVNHIARYGFKRRKTSLTRTNIGVVTLFVLPDIGELRVPRSFSTQDSDPVDMNVNEIQVKQHLIIAKATVTEVIAVAETQR